MKILILASNPRKDLNLDREIRDLKDVIEKSRNRQEFEVEDALAVRVGDLQNLLHRHRPQIVHFCGHGSGQQGLVFEGNNGGEQWVRAEALSEMFRLFSNNVGCVLLNACYSEEQANAIVNHIDYVIGMNQQIRDDAAIAFSKGFYRALGYGCSVEDAYEFGKNAIQLEISGSSKTRSAATAAGVREIEVVGAIQTTEIPEHLKPILRIRPTLMSSPRANITAPEQPLSQATRVAVQLEIDQSLTADTKVKQYRDEVREYLDDHKLADHEKVFLEQSRQELGLSIEEAKRILEEEQAPIWEAQQSYRNRLNGLIQSGLYPFNDRIKAELKRIQTRRNLTDEEVAEISQPILEVAEKEYQVKQAQQAQQEYEQRLQRYEKEFRKAIAVAYPIEEVVRAGLIRFQQSLGLRDEDVARIEEPIATPKAAEYQQQLERQREQQRQREQEQNRKLEQQRQREEQQKQEEAKRQPALKRFEFQVPIVNIGSQTIEKPGLFGKKTETVTTVNTTYQRGQAECFVEALGKDAELEMVAIASGTFTMGSSENADEQPQHRVTVQPFFMGKFAVTQAQWRAVAALPKVECDLNPDPSKFKGDLRPVEQVSWHAAVEFCDRLTQRTGRQYRLPSEVEWEYACRAGTTTPFYCGETVMTDLANYNGNSTYGAGTKGVYREQTTNVGSFPPNAFGLYDLHGNVWEWCADHWHGNYQGAPIDGSAWIEGGNDSSRLMRGGSWLNNPAFCRSACRYCYAPGLQLHYLGFRVVCVLA